MEHCAGAGDERSTSDAETAVNPGTGNRAGHTAQAAARAAEVDEGRTAAGGTSGAGGPFRYAGNAGSNRGSTFNQIGSTIYEPLEPRARAAVRARRARVL